jgi:hypothetical protein
MSASALRFLVVSSSSKKQGDVLYKQESIIKSGRAELTLSFPNQFCTFCSLKSIVLIHLPPTQSSRRTPRHIHDIKTLLA